MGKAIVKIALITTAAFLAAVLLLYGALALFFPSVMRDFLSNVGNDDRAAVYAESAYKKSNSFSDLLKLSELAMKNDNNELIAEYFDDLIASNELDAYIADGKTEIAFKDAICGSYVVALYNKKEKSNAELAKLAVSFSTEYRQSNAVRALIYNAVKDDNRELIQNIKTELEALNSQASLTLEAKAFVESDLKILEDYLLGSQT